MGTAYLVITIVRAAMAAFSGLGKLSRDPKIVHIVHESSRPGSYTPRRCRVAFDFRGDVLILSLLPPGSRLAETYRADNAGLAPKESAIETLCREAAMADSVKGFVFPFPFFW